MLLWILLTSGLALSVCAAACVAATIKAERRARRSLYSSLGLGEDLISVLMGRKESVAVQLALVRQAALAPARRNPPPDRDPV